VESLEKVGRFHNVIDTSLISEERRTMATKRTTHPRQMKRGKNLSTSLKKLPVIMPAAVKPRHFTLAQIRQAVRKAAESE
jgi:hypothetical protein